MKTYFDNNASTRVDEKVIETMLPYFTNIIALPSSDYGYSFGIEAKEALDNSRNLIAGFLNITPEELIFTSGQAESNNLAIKGLAFANMKKKSKLLVASSVSHSTVLEALKTLEKYFNFQIELLEVDENGFVKKDKLYDVLKRNPIFVSIPHGNVEIGTIEQIEELGKICHEFNVLLHADCTYSFCKVPLNTSHIDLATIDSQLIHGPKGIGALYVKKGINLLRQIDGGLQENRMRGGAENIPGIVGFAKAASLYTPEVVKTTRILRDYLWSLFEEKIYDYKITGPIDKSKRLPNHFSAVCYYVEGESILLHMDMLGFMISTGSACSSKQLKASHVLTAIGLPTEISHGSIRIGLSKYNTKGEIEEFINNLVKVIKKLREMSPMNADFMREWEEMKAKGLALDNNNNNNNNKEGNNEEF